MKVIVSSSKPDEKWPVDCPPFIKRPDPPIDPCNNFQFCYTSDIALDICPSYIRHYSTDVKIDIE